MHPPHGRPFYWTIAILGPLALLKFAGDAIEPDGRPVWMRAISVIVAAAFLMGFLQALERLFRPDNALERSRQLSDSTRERLDATRSALCTLSSLGMLTVLAVRLIGGKDHKDLSQNLWDFISAGICASESLADISGERRLGFGRRVSGQQPEKRLAFIGRECEACAWPALLRHPAGAGHGRWSPARPET